MTEKPSLVIKSDASSQAWGASFEGAQTDGPWSPKERQWRINCLKIVPTFQAVKCFAKDRTRVLQGYSEWTTSQWFHMCINQDITLVVEHLPRSPQYNFEPSIPINEGRFRLDVESSNL